MHRQNSSTSPLKKHYKIPSTDTKSRPWEVNLYKFNLFTTDTPETTCRQFAVCTISYRQNLKERIKNTKTAKFEAPGIKEFEFSDNLEDLYGKCCWRARPCSPATFLIQIFLFFKKIQTVIISHSLMMGCLKLGHFGIFDAFFPFHRNVYNPSTDWPRERATSELLLP